MGYQPDPVVTDLINRAKAFVYMATEDFGIAMVEAQAAGCPSMRMEKAARGRSSATGKREPFFQEQTAEALVDAVLKFETDEFKRQSRSGKCGSLFLRTF